MLFSTVTDVYCGKLHFHRGPLEKVKNKNFKEIQKVEETNP